MYKLEPLNNANLSFVDNFNITKEYREELIEIFNNNNIFKRLLFGKNIKFLKLDNKYIGFMWYSKLQHQAYKIHCIKLISEYNSIEYYEELFKFFNNSAAIIISDNNNLDKNVLVDLGFSIEKTIIEMEKDLKGYIELSFDANISFSIFEDGIDEKHRCLIQNQVFNSINRQAINEEDIHYEKCQKYYVSEGCVFIKYKKLYVGYGQLINKDNKLYIANFGILPKYRNRGYGKLLLRYIINVAQNLGSNKIYLKCDEDNIDAIKVYLSEGFKDINTYYEYSRNDILNYTSSQYY